MTRLVSPETPPISRPAIPCHSTPYPPAVLPAPSVLAERDARRLALVLSEIGGPGEAVAGGWMARDVDGSWADFAAGLGLEGPVSDADLDRLVAFYAEVGRGPKVQVTPYQHPSLVAGLGARGFVVTEQETLLVHPLHGGSPFGEDLASPPAGLGFHEVDGTDPVAVEAFQESHRLGFFGDAPLPEPMRIINQRVAAHPRVRLWLVTLDDAVVASGGLETHDGAAVLIAGSVQPEARRRGVHQAFLRFRVAEARRMGMDYAVIGSLVGGPTERNALRVGFVPAWSTALYERL